MSADLLRQAADRLDALADDATPGPWRRVGLTIRPGHESEAPMRAGVTLATSGESQPGSGCTWHAKTPADQREPDAAYIAAMSPTVGKALAAWLRLEAEVITSDHNPERLAAVAIAEALLGGAA